MKKLGRAIIMPILFFCIIIYLIHSRTISEAKRVTQNFLKAYYSVSEIEKEENQEQQEAILSCMPDKIIDTQTEIINNIYGKYFTEDGFNTYLGNGYWDAIITPAVNNAFTTSAVTIDLEECLAEETHAVYNYTVTIELLYPNEEKQSVTETGYINLIKTANDWKIDKLRLGIRNFSIQ